MNLFYNFKMHPSYNLNYLDLIFNIKMNLLYNLKRNQICNLKFLKSKKVSSDTFPKVSIVLRNNEYQVFLSPSLFIFSAIGFIIPHTSYTIYMIYMLALLYFGIELVVRSILIRTGRYPNLVPWNARLNIMEILYRILAIATVVSLLFFNLNDMLCKPRCNFNSGCLYITFQKFFTESGITLNSGQLPFLIIFFLIMLYILAYDYIYKTTKTPNFLNPPENFTQDTYRMMHNKKANEIVFLGLIGFMLFILIALGNFLVVMNLSPTPCFYTFFRDNPQYLCLYVVICEIYKWMRTPSPTKTSNVPPNDSNVSAEIDQVFQPTLNVPPKGPIVSAGIDQIFFQPLTEIDKVLQPMLNPATSAMEGIIDFHFEVMFFLIIIAVLVFYFLIRIIYFFSIRGEGIFFTKRSDNSIEFSFPYFKLQRYSCSPDLLGHLDYNNCNLYAMFPFFFNSSNYKIDTAKIPQHQLLETIWTIVPTIILFFIAIPSFALLYAINELMSPKITFKAEGNQWFWIYEYTYSRLSRDIQELLASLWKSFESDNVDFLDNDLESKENEKKNENEKGKNYEFKKQREWIRLFPPE